MPIVKLFSSMLDEYFPDGCIETLEHQGDYRLSATIKIGDCSYSLFLESHEDDEWILLYLFSPFRIPSSKYTDACVLFNSINDQYSYTGHVTVSDDGVICYKQIVNVEDAKPTTNTLRTMVESAKKLFENNIDAITKVSRQFAGNHNIICF